MSKAYIDIYKQAIKAQNSSYDYDEAYTIIGLNVGKHGLSKEQMISVFELFEYDNPEFFFIGGTIIAGKGDFLEGVKYSYSSNCLTQEDRSRMQSYLDAGKDKIDAEIAKYEKSDLNTIICVYRYIIDNITYAKEVDKKTVVNEDSVYNLTALSTGRGVCAAYSKLFKYYLDLYGIECICIGANGKDDSPGHAWNAVKINDKYYIFDLTSSDNDFNSWKYFGRSLDDYTALIANQYDLI